MNTSVLTFYFFDAILVLYSCIFIISMYNSAMFMVKYTHKEGETVTNNEVIRYLPVPDKEQPFKVLMAGISHFEKTYFIKRLNCAFYNCEIIVSGEGTVLYDGKEYLLKKGDVFVLPPGKPHTYYSSSENPWIKMFFCVNGSLSEALFREYDLNSAVILHAPELYPIFVDFFNHIFNKKLTVRETNAEAAIIFHRFVQALAESVPRQTTTEGQRLKEYIEQNAGEVLSVADMAAHIYRSQSQTIRIFRKEFGITPYEYYLEKRMELACTILCSSNYTVKEVSEMLGFTDESYFSKVFAKKIGISPGKYNQNADAPTSI